MVYFQKLILPISHDTLEDPYSLPCQHHFCKACIKDIADQAGSLENKCPVCKTAFWNRDMRKNIQLSNIIAATLSLIQSINLAREGSGHKKVRIASTRSPLSDKKKILHLCKSLDCEYTENVLEATHLVAFCDENKLTRRTIKYLKALVMGIPVLSIECKYLQISNR